MNEKDAIEIIIEAFEDARGSIYYRDEIQAVNCLEDYVKNSISKDKIRGKIEELKKKGDYRDIYNPTGRVHFVKEETDYQIDILEELLKE